MLSKNEVVKVRRDIERLYTSRCDIYEMTEYETQSGIIKHKEELTYTEVPCRLSYTTGMFVNRLMSSNSTGDALKSSQYVRILMPKEIDIKAGSTLNIRHNGEELIYYHSGKCAIYKTHKELLLENYKEWS